LSSANAEVSALVERALRDNPNLTASELKESAAEIDEGVLELSGRQFHALYALPVRRRLFGGRKQSTEDRKATATSGRDGTVEHILRDSYRQRKERLNEALDHAFRQALEAEDLARLDGLFAVLDTWLSDLEPS